MHLVNEPLFDATVLTMVTVFCRWDEKADPLRSTLCGSAKVLDTGSLWWPKKGEDRPMANGSRAATTKMMTVGLDLGDRYSYLCLLDPDSGEVLEEGRLRTTPEALKRSFSAREPMRVAIEAGTHSPWASRLLEECGHEVLVANPRKLHLIYKGKHKTDKLDAEWPDPVFCTRCYESVRPPRRTWHCYARARCSSASVRNSSTMCAERSSLWAIACPSARPRAATGRAKKIVWQLSR
jgi:hypothetical protein